MSSPARKSRGLGSGIWLWAGLLLIVGLVLLLDNFLLLGDFNAVSLLPLLLVVVGAQILLRGDVVPSTEARTFGITRGSVESGTLEVSSGAVDVEVRALQRDGRLIAGQYAAQSRPYLNVQNNYAHLKMERAATPWFTFADWQVGLARDLPWQLLVSTSLGQVNVDCSGLILQDAVLATGFGHIRFISPSEALGPVYLRSTLGNIYVVTPPGYRTQVTVQGSRLFSTRVDARRYEAVGAGVYVACDATEDAPLVEIVVSGTFGDAYLA